MGLLSMLLPVWLAVAPAPAEPLPATTRRVLANGLEVLVQRDTRLPVVAVHVRYHVGAVGDPYHRRGLAHVVEHLMFEGSKHIDVVAREAARGRAAVHHDNAETDLHSTDYFTLAPAGSLATILWLESDRMGFLRKHAGAATLARVRAIVAAERRQRRETDPRGARIDRLFGELFPPEHPYHHTVMGSHEAIAAVTLADVDRFLATHYTPHNATLTIVGDVPANVDRLIDRHFAGLDPPPAPVDPGDMRPEPAAPTPTRRHLVPPALSDRSAPRQDPEVILLTRLRPLRAPPPVPLAPSRVSRMPGPPPVSPTARMIRMPGPPAVLCGWPSPGVHEDGDAALDVLFAALEAGAFRRLAGTDATALADFNAQQVSQPAQSIALVELHGQAGADPAALHRILQRVLTDVASGALDPGEIRRARLRLATRLRVAAQDLPTRAALLSSYAAIFDDPDALERDAAQWLAVTPEEVATAAHDLLAARSAAVLSGPP